VAAAPSSFVNRDISGQCATTAAEGANAAWTLHGQPIAPNTPIPLTRITAAR